MLLLCFDCITGDTPVIHPYSSTKAKQRGIITITSWSCGERSGKGSPLSVDHLHSCCFKLLTSDLRTCPTATVLSKYSQPITSECLITAKLSLLVLHSSTVHCVFNDLSIPQCTAFIYLCECLYASLTAVGVHGRVHHSEHTNAGQVLLIGVKLNLQSCETEAMSPILRI